MPRRGLCVAHAPWSIVKSSAYAVQCRRSYDMASEASEAVWSGAKLGKSVADARTAQLESDRGCLRNICVD